MRCEAWATVCFNFCTSGTDDANHIFVPFSDFSKNKNPAESGESSSNSAGSTALRLVDEPQRRTNACLKISLHSVTIVLSILPKRIHH